jgi:hypothetical protein
LSDDGCPHLITARDVGFDESPVKNHTQLSKLRAFYDTHRLKTCESVKEREIAGTHLIICNYEANEMLLEHCW